MRNMISALSAVQTYRSSNTVNHEGFPAWSMDDEERLIQLAMTGTLGSSFYADGNTMVAEAIKLLQRADAGSLANAIRRGRNEGFIRTFPLLGLVFLSQKSPALFQQVFLDVVLTGNDLVDFITMVRKVRGLGRSVKRAIHKYLDERVTPYYAMKYRRQLADAIRISRYAGTDPIYNYILSSYKSVKGNTPEKLEAVYTRYPEFAARREFIEMLDEGVFDYAASILRDNKLDVESLSAYYSKFDCDVWEAAAEVTPVMRFLKYLSKYARENVDILKIAKTKLNVKNLKAAKVFPFRLYTAYQAVIDYRIAEYLQDLLDEYTLAYDWSSFNRYSWVIAPDMSGSMFSRIGKSNSLTYADVAAMFTGFFTRGLDQVTVLPWNTEVLPYDMGRDTPVMEQINYLKNKVDGGTFMECGVDYMLKNRIKADFSVFITDCEEYGSGWLEAWKRYKAFYPQAQAVLLRLDSYGSNPMSETDARKYGIRQVFGWNDAVVDYIKFIVENRKD